MDGKWIEIGWMADGGQADTLFYKLTHAYMCMNFTERVSACPPGLPSTFYIAISLE